MFSREHKTMICAELDEIGVKYDFELGGKHPFVSIKRDGKPDLSFHFPGTPSDHRAVKNCRAELRRFLKANEIIEQPKTEIDHSEETHQSSPLVVLSNGAPCVSSRTVGEHFGKMHKDVLKAIRELIAKDPQWGERNFAPFIINDLTGKSTSHYEMSRDGFQMLAMGFTGDKAFKWKLKYIDAFNAMEQEIRKYAEQPLISRIEALEAENARMKANHEAMSDLVLEIGSSPRIANEPNVIVFKRPFVSARAEARKIARRMARAF